MSEPPASTPTAAITSRSAGALPDERTFARILVTADELRKQAGRRALWCGMAAYGATVPAVFLGSPIALGMLPLLTGFGIAYIAAKSQSAFREAVVEHGYSREDAARWERARAAFLAARGKEGIRDLAEDAAAMSKRAQLPPARPDEHHESD